MSVGLAITKSEINTHVGNLARSFQKNFKDVVTMQQYLADTLDVDLVELGYTQPEVAVLKAAFADLEQLGRIWIGTAALAAPKDFRQWVKKLAGIGAF